MNIIEAKINEFNAGDVKFVKITLSTLKSMKFNAGDVVTYNHTTDCGGDKILIKYIVRQKTFLQTLFI